MSSIFFHKTNDIELLQREGVFRVLYVPDEVEHLSGVNGVNDGIVVVSVADGASLCLLEHLRVQVVQVSHPAHSSQSHTSHTLATH